MSTQLQPTPRGHAQSLPRRVIAQGRYETLTALRNGEQLLVSIILPLLALFGTVWTGLLDTPQTRGIDIAVPGVLALAVLSSAFTGQGIATAFERRYGVLAYLSTTPLGPAGLLLGKALSVLALLVVQVSVIGGVGLALGWRPALPGLPWAILFLACGAAAFTALGLLIAGTTKPEATLALTNLLWVLLGALGGSVLPVPDAGVWSVLASFLPSAALGDGLRAALMDGSLDGPALLVLLGWAALATLAAVRWFRWR